MFLFASFSPESVIDEAVENDETEQWQKSIQHHVHVDHVDLRLKCRSCRSEINLWLCWSEINLLLCRSEISLWLWLCPKQNAVKSFLLYCSKVTVPTNTQTNTGLLLKPCNSACLSSVRCQWQWGRAPPTPSSSTPSTPSSSPSSSPSRSPPWLSSPNLSGFLPQERSTPF